MYHLVYPSTARIQNPSSFPFFVFMSKSIIEKLQDQQTWEEYLAYQLRKDRLDWDDFETCDRYVEDMEFAPVAAKAVRGDSLGIPHKKIINKMGTGKKRTVYTFDNEAMAMLKVIAHQLYKYDYHFSSDCFAFRRGLRPSDAVLKVHRKVCDKPYWAYKLDIHDYFNSIAVPILLPKLKEMLADDPMLYEFLERMLTEERVEYNGEIFKEQHGVMAGLPTSTFLANVYLSEMDHFFSDKGAIYARYSDDIIIFAEDYETLLEYRSLVKDFLDSHCLAVNPSKEKIYSPGEPFEFLGFRCFGRTIDIASASIEKMKGKIRRKMRALSRWKDRKGVAAERAMGTMIKIFNDKFFGKADDDSLTWSRWYFPVINADSGLKQVDQYLQQCLRALATGRHYKGNYRITYDMLKQYGYKSLVHEFYEWRKCG